MTFWTYVLRCADGSYYTGHTDDLEKRIAEHQGGLIEGYTSTRLPISVEWSQQFVTRGEALDAERRIKGWSRAKKEALIRGDWDGLQVLSRKLFLRRTFDTPLAAATQDQRRGIILGPLVLSSGPSEATGRVSKDGNAA